MSPPPSRRLSFVQLKYRLAGVEYQGLGELAEANPVQYPRRSADETAAEGGARRPRDSCSQEEP
jgi:hypothetical protein